MVLSGAVNAFADTDKGTVYEYIRVTKSELTIDKMYYEFEYPDYDWKGNDDAMRDIEILIQTTRLNGLIATMPRCHDEMQRFRPELGALQIMGTRDVDPKTGETIKPDEDGDHHGLRIVTVRYYPTYEVVRDMIFLCFSAGWDTDDNGSINFYVSEDLYLSNKNPTFEDNGHWGSIDFNGARQFIKNYKLGNFNDYGWTVMTRASQHEEFDHWERCFDGEYKENMSFVLDGTSYLASQNVRVWSYLKRDIDVINGSYHNKDDKLRITQIVSASSPLILCYDDTNPFYVTYANAKTSGKYGHYIIYIGGSHAMQADIYRQDIDTQQLFYLATVDVPEGGEGIYIDTGSNLFVKTNYRISPRKPEWTDHTSDFPYRYLLFENPLELDMKGKGTQEYPYEIYSVSDFNRMRIYQNNGKNVEGTHWILKNDIEFPAPPDSEMMFETGVEEHPFDGVFDGNGHTITVNVNGIDEKDGGNKDTKALFGYVEGGVIKNLKVTGNINVYSLFGAGLVNRMYGGTIENCLSDVTLTSYFDGDGTMAGFCSTTEPASKPNLIKNCVFTGRIQAASGNNTYKCGGLIGWSRKGTSTARLVNCLNLGSYSNINTGGCDAMVRNGAEIENCYYLNSLGGNATGAVKLNDSHKGVALLDRFGLGYYHYSFDGYPELKTFSGDDTDMELDGNLRFATTRDYAGADILLARSFSKREYYTLTLPFDVDEAKAQEIGRFYTLNKIIPGSRRVIFTPVSGGLKANTPYVMESAFNLGNIRFDDVTLKSTASMPDASKAPSSTKLVGTTKPVTAPEGAYGYSAGDDAVHSRGDFVKVGTGVRLPAFCAYLWINGNAPRTMEAVFTDENGDITGIETLCQDEENPAVYSLDGRKLDKPERGINIINGKKVVVR